jgi:hypothetical protein
MVNTAAGRELAGSVTPRTPETSPRPVTSRATPLPCHARSSAVAVCGAILSFAASAFGVSTGARASAQNARERDSAAEPDRYVVI